MAHDISQIRNIGIVGQGGGGKTSLADALLFTAGAVTRQGSVDDGTSAFDFEPEEMRRKLTLTTAFHHATWKKHALTIVDTPGYINFLTDGLNCLRACTAAVLVCEAHAGSVKVEAERIWDRADELALPLVAFVTKMDRDNADFDAVLADLGGHLQAKPIPVQLPIGSAANFAGAVDLLSMKALLAQPNGQVREGAIPAELADAAKAAREKLMEAAAETDDALVEQYLEHGELTTEQLLPALRIAVRERRFLPVLVGAGARGLGIAPLLDFLVEYTPSPAERGDAGGEEPKSGEPIERPPSPSAPFSAVVIKNVVDPFSGKLSIFQVVSGEVAGDATVLNVAKDARERLGHLLRLEGKKQSPVDKLTTGEIGAVAKLKDTDAGDTLADEKAPIRYPGLVPAAAAIAFAVEPKAKGDEDKVVHGLHKLIEEDPTLAIQRDAQTKEIILSGVGQLHIEVTAEKLKRKFGVEVELKAPKVPYKETIKGSAKAQGRLKKQTGGRGQFGDAWVEVSPLARGAGFEFVDAVVGGVIPRNFIPAVEKGVREALHEGILAGCEVVDVRVKLYDGSFHTVDSSEMAFKIAGSMAFKSALQQARPILLEPIMAMEIAVPDEAMGDVIGDLNSRRGKVLGVDPRIGTQVIRALAPMAEVLRYSPDLRSMTSGRGAFTMQFDHYDELPAHLAEKVVKESESRKAAH